MRKEMSSLKKRDYSLYIFGIGLVLIFIQMSLIVFRYVNPDLNKPDDIIVIAKQITVKEIINDIWSGVLGTIVLIVLFVRRMLKGPDAMMTLVGAMLWIIQILALREPSMDLVDVVLKYLFGTIGLGLVSISAFYDAYVVKNAPEKPSDDDKY